jgi:hypothetical protein
VNSTNLACAASADTGAVATTAPAGAAYPSSEGWNVSTSVARLGAVMKLL